MLSYDRLFVGSGALGAAGALTIIAVHVFAPSTRCQSRQLLFWLSVADLIQALFFCVYLAPWLDDRTVCLAHSVAGVVGAGSSFLWTACMAYYVHFSVVHPGIHVARQLVLAFHVLCWGYPLAIALAMVAHSRLEFEYPVLDGRLGWFCCFRPPAVWTVLNFELPLVLCWVYTLVMYLKAQRALGAQALPPQLTASALAELRTKFLRVPLIFVLLRLWAFLDLALILGFPQYRSPRWISAVMHLRALCDPLQGFCNAVVFIGMNPIVWYRARQEMFGVASQPMQMQKPSPAVGPGPASSYNTFSSAEGSET